MDLQQTVMNTKPKKKVTFQIETKRKEENEFDLVDLQLKKDIYNLMNMPPKQEPSPSGSFETYNDNVKIEDVLVDIAQKYEWTEEKLNANLNILLFNRIRTVKNLRVIIYETDWKGIEGLLPNTKLLLQRAVNL